MRELSERGVKRDGSARMTEALRNASIGSVFSDHDDVTY